MTATIIDGKKIAAKIEEDITKAIQKRKTDGLTIPGLAVILVDHDPASAIYVRNKHKACKRTGIFSKSIELSTTVTENELLKIIDRLNNDSTIHGILVQLPLPKHIITQNILEAIDPKKDVDGFHPYNLGRLAQKHPLLQPCTPFGIMKILKEIGAEISGKDVVVVGASTIVGLPVALELLNEHATVTVCHRYTKNLADKVKGADILIVAVGKVGLIKGEWIKPGAIVIDVGINRLSNGKLAGDVEFESAKERASWITPVPGGVGPMTVATLMSNTLIAAELWDK